MDRIHLADDAVEASRLGYGCASLMAQTGHRDSLRLLEVAHEAGVTHFDVARSYGYGEAESVLGEFAARRRDEITIATKLGIAPPRPSRILTAAKSAARGIVAVAPGARRLIRRQAERLVGSPQFDPSSAAESLEASLRELRTDYVDLLFLHDCEPEDVTPELLEFLRGRVAAGQVRAFGIATGVAAVTQIVGRSRQERLVAQVPHAGLSLECPRPGAPGGLIVHSVLTRALGEIGSAVESGTIDAAAWSRRIDAAVNDRAAMAPLLLRAVLGENPDAVVLFSTRQESRIRSNADAATPREMPADRRDALRDLLDEVAQARPAAAAGSSLRTSSRR